MSFTIFPLVLRLVFTAVRLLIRNCSRLWTSSRWYLRNRSPSFSQTNMLLAKAIDIMESVADEVHSSLMIWSDIVRGSIVETHNQSFDIIEDRAIAAMDATLLMINQALNHIDIDIAHFPIVVIILKRQVQALTIRFELTKESQDIERAIYLAELMRHFCDSSQFDVLLWSFQVVTVLASQRDSLLRSQQCRPIPFLQHFPPNFVNTSVSVINSAIAVAQVSPKDRDTKFQKSLLVGLDEIVSLTEDAMEDCDPSQEQLGVLAEVLLLRGLTFKARFHLLGGGGDLDNSITSLQTAACICDPSSSQAASISEPLIRCVLARAYGSRNVDDCDYLIRYSNRMLPVTTGDRQPTLRSARARATSLLSLLGRMFSPSNQMLAYFDECDWSALGESEVHPLATFLFGQLKLIAIDGDFESALWLLQTIHARNFSSKDRVLFDIFTKYPVDGIKAASQLLKRHCYSLPASSEHIKPIALVLAHALAALYYILHNENDLQDALRYRSLLGPRGLYGPILDLAVVSLSANDSPAVGGLDSRAASLNSIIRTSLRNSTSLGNVHRRGKLRRGFEHLEPDISAVAKLSSEDGPRDWYLSPWGTMALESVRGCNLGPRRQQELVEYLDRLIQGVDPSAEDVLGSVALKSAWVTSLFKLQATTGDVDISRTIRALGMCHECATSTHYALHNPLRVSFIVGWLDHFLFLRTTTNHNHGDEHLAQMCRLALSVLKERSWMASNVWGSIDDRRFTSMRIGEKVVAAALWAADINDCDLVIEVVEQLYGLLWGQLRQLRAPVDTRLVALNPGLASRLQTISSTIEKQWALSESNQDCHSAVSQSFLTPSTFDLYEERNTIINEIRSLPGLADFYKFNFSEIGLHVGNEGPAVLLISTMGISCGIVFIGSRHILVPLSLPEGILYVLHQSIKQTTGSREGDQCSFGRDPGPSVASSDHERAGRPRRRGSQSMEDILETLWTNVAEPILDTVLHWHSSVAKGKARAWKVPKLGERRRIWWCCMGEFSFMPIHAAGIFRGDSPICISDFFVSSYTPTLSALVEARKRPVPLDLKVLAAAQPNPGWPFGSIPLVKDELAEVAQNVPPQNLIFLEDANGKLDFEGQHTSVQNVIEKLSEASILHLMCHGTQDARNPLDSGFVLARGEKLTIRELIKHRLPNAHLAISSACHTASNDAEQPEESINLSSALMFIGFSSILGTKWPMADRDGPMIAKAVYQALFNPQLTSPRPGASMYAFKRLWGPQPVRSKDQQNRRKNSVSTEQEISEVVEEIDSALTEGSGSTLPTFSLAHTVDDIARELRFRGASIERWATFVHIGV